MRTRGDAVGSRVIREVGGCDACHVGAVCPAVHHDAGGGAVVIDLSRM